jgi:signal transduction histidine kinase
MAWRVLMAMNPETTPRRVAVVGAAAAGAGAALLGFVVLTGWWLDNPAFVRIPLAASPMHVNAALGFLLCGFGLLSAALERPRAAMLAGAASLLVGGLTLAEYASGRSLGVDELLFRQEIGGVRVAGRMASATAVCFVLTGLALLAGGAGWLRTGRAWLNLGLGSTVLGLAGVTGLGYLAGIEDAYIWGGTRRMALPSALGFALLGAGLAILPWRETRDHAPAASQRSRMPVLEIGHFATGGVAACFLVLIVVLSVSIWSHARSGYDFDYVHRAHDAKLAIGEVRAGVFDLEAAERGYAMSGDPRLIEACGDAEQEVFRTLSALRQAIREDENMQEELRALISLISQRIQWSRATVQLRQSGDVQGAAARLSAAQGQRLTRAIRDTVQQMQEDQDRLLDLRGRQVARTVAVTTATMGAGVALIAATASLVITRVNRDVRRQKQMAEDLQAVNAALEKYVAALEAAYAEVERRNVELDQFTYLASHDLQEPLRKLLAFGSLLPKDLEGELPQKAAQDLGFITDAARRMQTLVRDLLALSRAGRNAMSREPVRLDACVDRALQDLALRIEESQAVVERVPLPEVLGDATLLTQLYQNLLGNALKFVLPGRRPEIRLTAERAGEEWVLGVQDNGLGIKPEYAETIFAPFKRLHGVGEYEGTGIGLAICRRVVERHGGRIWVESEPGRGSHFRFAMKTAKEAGAWDDETASPLSSCS